MNGYQKGIKKPSRAAWKGRTPCPVLHEDEPEKKPIREDITTPDLQAVDIPTPPAESGENRGSWRIYVLTTSLIILIIAITINITGNNTDDTVSAPTQSVFANTEPSLTEEPVATNTPILTSMTANAQASLEARQTLHVEQEIFDARRATADAQATNGAETQEAIARQTSVAFDARRATADAQATALVEQPTTVFQTQVAEQTETQQAIEAQPRQPTATEEPDTLELRPVVPVLTSEEDCQRQLDRELPVYRAPVRMRNDERVLPEGTLVTVRGVTNNNEWGVLEVGDERLWFQPDDLRDICADVDNSPRRLDELMVYQTLFDRWGYQPVFSDTFTTPLNWQNLNDVSSPYERSNAIRVNATGSRIEFDVNSDLRQQGFEQIRLDFAFTLIPLVATGESFVSFRFEDAQGRQYVISLIRIGTGSGCTIEWHMIQPDTGTPDPNTVQRWPSTSGVLCATDWMRQQRDWQEVNLTVSIDGNNNVEIYHNLVRVNAQGPAISLAATPVRLVGFAVENSIVDFIYFSAIGITGSS